MVSGLAARLARAGYEIEHGPLPRQFHSAIGRGGLLDRESQRAAGPRTRLSKTLSSFPDLAPPGRPACRVKVGVCQGLVKVSVTVGDRRARWLAASGGLKAGRPVARPVTEPGFRAGRRAGSRHGASRERMCLILGHGPC